MKARWKILIAIVTFFAALTCLWLVTMHVQPANEVDAYKKVLRDQGEKLEISELIPDPVPPEQNAADAVDDAFRLMGSANAEVPNLMLMVAPSKAVVGWSQPLVHGLAPLAGDSTNTWDEFAAIVSADRPSIELLKPILVRPKLDFHLEYKNGFTMLLPRLAPLKRSAQELSAATLFDLHIGDNGSAATNLCVLLGLIDGEQDERTLISHLVRIAMASIATAPTWELLQATNTTDQQLAMVQECWQREDFIRPWPTRSGWSAPSRWMPWKNARIVRYFQRARGWFFEWCFRRKCLELAADLDSMADGARYQIGGFMWRMSWSYSQELKLLHTEQVILESLKSMETNLVLKPDYDAMMSHLSSLGLTNTEGALFEALRVPDFSEIFGGSGTLTSVVRKAMKMEAGRRVVVTAIALKRFQLKHGQLPNALSELAPDFLSGVPLDPYDGLPLRYRLKADETFLLYSIGEDGVDDGGDAGVIPSSTSSRGLTVSQSLFWQGAHVRDWVWPQPATEAEIEKYYGDEAATQK